MSRSNASGTPQGVGGLYSPFVEGGPPFLAVFFQQIVGGVRVPFGKASNLIDGLLGVGFVEFGFAGVYVGYFPGGVSQKARAVVVDHALAVVRVYVHEPLRP